MKTLKQNLMILQLLVSLNIYCIFPEYLLQLMLSCYQNHSYKDLINKQGLCRMWILYCRFCYRAPYQPVEQLLPVLSKWQIQLLLARMDPLIDRERGRTGKVISLLPLFLFFSYLPIISVPKIPFLVILLLLFNATQTIYIKRIKKGPKSMHQLYHADMC